MVGDSFNLSQPPSSKSQKKVGLGFLVMTFVLRERYHPVLTVINRVRKEMFYLTMHSTHFI